MLEEPKSYIIETMKVLLTWAGKQPHSNQPEHPSNQLVCWKTSPCFIPQALVGYRVIFV